jgi:hypothetical protein
MPETTLQRKARERREAQAHTARQRAEGQAVMATMTCPRCGEPLAHNNSLAGSWWLQCPTPTSVYHAPGNGCGWQILWSKD